MYNKGITSVLLLLNEQLDHQAAGREATYFRTSLARCTCHHRWRLLHAPAHVPMKEWVRRYDALELAGTCACA